MHVHIELLAEDGVPLISPTDPTQVLMVPAEIAVSTEHECPNAEGDFDWDIHLIARRPDVDDAVHEIEELTFKRRPGGPPIGWEAMRISLTDIVTQALQATTRRGRMTANYADGTFDVEWEPGWSPATELELRQTVVRKPKGGVRRNAPDPDEVASVQNLFEHAKKQRIPNPAKWVGDQVGLSRSRVYDYINMAEEQQ